MDDKTVTIRTLAAALRLSRATISAALRGTGRVAHATQVRVREAAKQAGYRHNPLAGALMSELRRSRSQSFQGVVAAIEILDTDRPGHRAFHQALMDGASNRAAALGFKLEHLAVGGTGLSLLRANTILQSRGITGLLLLPSWHAPDFSGFPWERYAAVYTDYNLAEPRLHCVCGEPYALMTLALERLRGLGYERPGMVIEKLRNERLHRQHTAAFHAFASGFSRTVISPLVLPTLTRAAFETWFRKHQPDVVLCHFSEVIEWMEACGARVPATHGFVSLNHFHPKLRPCTALDLQPREIGARGMELVVAQLHSNARGIPPTATRTTIPPRWVDGPTVRLISAR